LAPRREAVVELDASTDGLAGRQQTFPVADPAAEFDPKAAIYGTCF
jgi:hypothetical protein